MGFALLNYNIASSTISSMNDLTAATDPDFSVRNGHYIFTEQYNLLAVGLFGNGISRGRFQVPTWNAVGEASIFNVNRSVDNPSNAQLDWYTDSPMPVPQMEEFQVQAFDNGTGTAIVNGPIWLGTQDWNANLPRGRQPILVRATFTVVHTLNGWSGPQAITLSQSLRGGVYAVVGAVLQADDASLFRIIFPRYRLYHGRKLRPGYYCQNTIGDVIGLHGLPESFRFGEWGRFHTFELPTVETFGVAADSTACILWLWCIYLGEDVSQLNQGLGGGM